MKIESQRGRGIGLFELKIEKLNPNRILGRCSERACRIDDASREFPNFEFETGTHSQRDTVARHNVRDKYKVFFLLRVNTLESSHCLGERGEVTERPPRKGVGREHPVDHLG